MHHKRGIARIKDHALRRKREAELERDLSNAWKDPDLLDQIKCVLCTRGLGCVLQPIVMVSQQQQDMSPPSATCCMQPSGPFWHSPRTASR